MKGIRVCLLTSGTTFFGEKLSSILILGKGADNWVAVNEDGLLRAKSVKDLGPADNIRLGSVVSIYLD